MRFLIAAVALGLSTCLTTPVLAETATMAESAPALTFERVFASPALDGPAPRQVKLSPDGRFLTLLRNRPEERERYDLWGYDIETGEWRMLVDSQALGSGRELSEDEKMQRERARVAGLKGLSPTSGRATARACWCRSTATCSWRSSTAPSRA